MLELAVRILARVRGRDDGLLWVRRKRIRQYSYLRTVHFRKFRVTFETFCCWNVIAIAQ